MLDSYTVKTPARLHFGLIDLSGATRRVDGGVGLMVSEPSFEVHVSRSRSLLIEGSEVYKDRCIRVVEKLAPIIRNTGYKISIVSEIPVHCGFGSGTQSMLAIATAICHLEGQSHLSSNDLARILGRGGTSGIGCHGFRLGGFMVEAGHKWPEEKSRFGPSSTFSKVGPPPLVARYGFPDWGIIIALPVSSNRVSGETELALFDQLTPISLYEVGEISRTILFELLPAVIDADIDQFHLAMSALRQLGFKKREIEVSGASTQQVIQLFEDNEIRGVSMSSWGPAVFGFTRSFETAKRIASMLNGSPLIARTIVTQANNIGVECLQSD
jgi:beta-ribofuranosylaminobenzene 5'-phosphate synthase